MNDVPSTYEPLWEAKQEAMKEGNRSYGTKNSNMYKRSYGPFMTELEYLESVGRVDLTREIH